MAIAVKKTISLPPDLAEEAETTAREEGKTSSAVIQDALRSVASCGCRASCGACKVTGRRRRRSAAS